MDKVDQMWQQLYEEGGRDLIRELLQLDPKQAEVTQYGVSLLHIAAGAGYSDEALLLVNFGANVNLTDEDGNTPLHRAAKASDPIISRILLERGALATIQNRHGQTPIDLAQLGDPWASQEDYNNTVRLLNNACKGKNE